MMLRRFLGTMFTDYHRPLTYGPETSGGRNLQSICEKIIAYWLVHVQVYIDNTTFFPISEPLPRWQWKQKQLTTYYHHCMYRSEEILGFLILKHNLAISKTCSRKTIRRLGLRRNNNEAPVTDIISKIQHLLHNGFANAGNMTIWRLLNSHYSLRVTRLMVAIYTEGVILRRHRVLRRRTYISLEPNFMIHIDGYEKLKPYGFPIHWAMDGFSRTMMVKGCQIKQQSSRNFKTILTILSNKTLYLGSFEATPALKI